MVVGRRSAPNKSSKKGKKRSRDLEAGEGKRANLRAEPRGKRMRRVSERRGTRDATAKSGRAVKITISPLWCRSLNREEPVSRTQGGKEERKGGKDRVGRGTWGREEDRQKLKIKRSER